MSDSFAINSFLDYFGLIKLNASQQFDAACLILAVTCVQEAANARAKYLHKKSTQNKFNKNPVRIGFGFYSKIMKAGCFIKEDNY